MEVWIRDSESAALLYKVHDVDRTIFKKYAFDLYQSSPLGWVKTGKTHYSSSKPNAIQKLANLQYQKDPNQKNLYPLGDLLSL
jgi:hypothetical protein